MSHGIGSYIIAQYPTSRCANDCAQELKSFFPKHAATLSGNSSSGPSSAQTQLGARLNFDFDGLLTWGRDTFFESMPLVHSLGCELMVYHSYCHSEHDFEEGLGAYFKATGATISGKGRMPTISVTFRLACKIKNTDPVLPFYQAYKQMGFGPCSLKNFRAARDALIRLETLFQEKWSIDDNYWRCFGETTGEFPEFISFEYADFVCDGILGSLKMPFNGDLPCLEKFLHPAAFEFSSLAWCETGTRAELCKLTNLRFCPNCNGRDLEFVPKRDEISKDQIRCLSCRSCYSHSLLHGYRAEVV